MAIKHRKSYRFALRSSLLVSVTMTCSLWVLLYFTMGIDYTLILLFLCISFVLSFFILQIRVEKFIYRRVKKIYDEVSLLESSSLADDLVTTDMKTLTEEIGRFAAGKKIEIDTLKIRE